MSDISSLIGKTVLGYNVTEFIGQGGFGKVYKAVKVTGNDQYYAAIKHIVLPNEGNYNDILNSMGGNYDAADDYFEAMLNDMISEIKTLFSLSRSNNQNIVTYYDHDIVKHTNPLKYEIFIRMEYLKPLSTHIRENDITLQDVLKLGIDMSNALEYCHSQGVIHRDVKDDNIFINEDGNYKLGDFGISKALMNTKQALSIKGTPVYMAPEVILGKKYDKSVDIYSLGILLYKLLNYNRIPFLPKYPLPFTSRDTEQAIEARLSGKDIDPPMHLSFALAKVLLKACAVQENRYTDAKQLSNDLSEILNSMPQEELSKVLYKKAERNINKDDSQNANTNGDSEQTVGAGRENQGYINTNDENYKGKDLFQSQKQTDNKEKSVGTNNKVEHVKYRKTSNKLVIGMISLVIVLFALGILLAKSFLGDKNKNVNNNSSTKVAAGSNTAGSSTNTSTQGENSKSDNKTQADSASNNAAANKSNSTDKKTIDVSKCNQTIFNGKTVVTLTSVELNGKDMIIKGEVDNKAKDTASGHVSKFYLKYKDNNINKLDFFSNASFNIDAPSGAKAKFEMVYNDVDTSSDSISLYGEFFMMSYFGSDNKININIPLK